ncbi:MAG: hypothetical protein JSS83_22225 [Cyanobacteria bacterium SZAS LIN-3]|nr:hypothetical protein [Cyanobacteria bacterium SZAS LIN-3]MBS2005753.1 hypothetical protein [Cyanobacteria bacterium SZAS TMP-1]
MLNFLVQSAQAKRPQLADADEGATHKLAVLDTETTGVHRNRDRIIEIAIIQCDDKGNVEDQYVTLINPNRDLGATAIHQISAGDVRNAPEFSEIAGDILDRLSDRVVVGHNVQFDLGMLAQELLRLDVALPQPTSLCTLRLAYTYGPKSRKLKECCAHFGIDNPKEHSAIYDAEVTRLLLQKYRELAKEEGITNLKGLKGFHDGAYEATWPSLPISGKTATRRERSEAEVHPFLATLLPRLPETDRAEIAAYCSLLDRALEDRRLDESEIEELTKVALEGGFSRHEVLAAHREYLHGIIETALADGEISNTEQVDIETVASLLGFDKDFVNEAIKRVRSQEVTAPSKTPVNQLTNRTVCFTGSMTCTINGVPISRQLAQELARQNGLVPVDGVTKKTDILVIADPDSMSGKAKKARDYGTRIIADRVFWNMLGIPTE